MPHLVEAAKSGRAKCRGCNRPIQKGELRFGECLPNPFADDSEMTLWYHIKCGALRRPEAFAEVLDHELIETPVEARTELESLVNEGIEHYRLDRIYGVEQAPSGRARCRHCREMIAKGDWRIPLVFFEEGMFNTSGFVHVSCGAEYFGTANLLPRLRHFGEVDDAEIAALEALL